MVKRQTYIEERIVLSLPCTAVERIEQALSHYYSEHGNDPETARLLEWVQSKLTEKKQ